MLTFLLQLGQLYIPPPTQEDTPSWIMFLAFISPVFLYVYHVLTSKNAEKEWEKSVITAATPLTRDNLFQAYVGLAARFIQADREEAGMKVRYMSGEFKRRFPEHQEDFSELLLHAYRNPLDIRSASLWLKRKLPYEHRIQVLYFLTGLAYVDGSMNSREQALLNQLAEVMEITPKDFQSVLSVYFQQHHRAEEPRQYTSQSAIKLSCEILGVSENASLDEIKKAYRQMAKKHHPDRFATEGPEQQRIALERFQEIQKAYEILEKHR